MAKAKYYLLLCEPVTRRGGRAHRPGVARRRRRPTCCRQALEVAEQARRRARRRAIRWTKYALNNWLRLAGPTFDSSLALEFMGFAGPDVKEGIASLRGRRPPSFEPVCPF